MNRTTPVALQLFSVHDECAADFESTLRAVRKMGYDGVEFAGLYGKTAAELRPLLDELKLTAISAHVSIDEMLADPDGVMECYRALGCKYIAVPFLEAERRIGGCDYDRTIEELRELVKAASKHGLTLMYHNHDFEFVTVNGRYALDILLSSVPDIDMELDCCWAAVAGAEPAALIRKYQTRSHVVHLKDFHLVGKKPGNVFDIFANGGGDASDENGSFGFRPCGGGDLNLPSLMDAIDASEAEWVVVEQDAPAPNSTAMADAEKSVKYLKGLE